MVMYRQIKGPESASVATCPTCKSTKVQLTSGSIFCKDCGELIVKTKHGTNRAKNNDYSKSRTCKKCGQIYYKDKRANSQIWNRTKFCSNKCSVDSRRLYNSSIEKQAAHRRRQGRPVIGSVENSEKISRLTKLAMQRPEVQEKIRAPRNALTLEHRMKVSQAHAGKMPKNISYSSGGYGNVQRGYYDINGTTMYFRSKWEANYALYLDKLIDLREIYKWEFEPYTFMFEAIKLGTRSYTPDFKVWTDENTFEWHEVKGYMDSKSKTKLKRFKRYYPTEKLVLIDAPVYNEIKKKLGELCKFYK